jgi:hypothetical protein
MGLLMFANCLPSATAVQRERSVDAGHWNHGCGPLRSSDPLEKSLVVRRVSKYSCHPPTAPERVRFEVQSPTAWSAESRTATAIFAQACTACLRPVVSLSRTCLAGRVRPRRAACPALSLCRATGLHGHTARRPWAAGGPRRQRARPAVSLRKLRTSGANLLWLQAGAHGHLAPQPAVGADADVLLEHPPANAVRRG